MIYPPPPFIRGWPTSRGGKRIVFGKIQKVDFCRWYNPVGRVIFITALILPPIWTTPPQDAVARLDEAAA